MSEYILNVWKYPTCALSIVIRSPVSETATIILYRMYDVIALVIICICRDAVIVVKIILREPTLLACAIIIVTYTAPTTFFLTHMDS